MHPRRFFAETPDWIRDFGTGLAMAAIVSIALFGGLYCAA